MRMLSPTFSTHRRSGFTLIEILVVMAIIGVLVTLGVGSFRGSQLKSRDTRRKTDLKQITTALEAYYNDWSQYPLDDNGFIAGCNGGQSCAWGGSFADQNGTIYMPALPSDPRANHTYRYVSATGNSYILYARLENDQDSAVGSYPGVSCGSEECNYAVSSSNITP